MSEAPSDFRKTMLRARWIGRRLLDIYGSEREETPPELLELLDIAEIRLKQTGHESENDLLS